MIGIVFVALMVFLGPIAITVIDKAAPLPKDEFPRIEYYGPSRRVFEIARALS